MIADMILFWMRVVPLTDNSSTVQFVMKINLGGSIPNRIQSMISRKQADFCNMIGAYCINHAAEIDKSWQKHESKIMAEIEKVKLAEEEAKQKAERKLRKKEAKQRALKQAEEERLRAEQAKTAAPKDNEFQNSDEDDMQGVTERNPSTARGLMMRQYDKERNSLAPLVSNEETAKKEPQDP